MGGRLFTTGSGTDKGFGKVGLTEWACGPTRVLLFPEFASGLISQFSVGMAPTIAAPSPAAKGESSANFAQSKEVRIRVTNLDVTGGTPSLVLRMDPVACDVCTAAAIERLSEPNGATILTQALRDYFAPEAVGSISRRRRAVCILSPPPRPWTKTWRGPIFYAAKLCRGCKWAARFQRRISPHLFPASG